ncbi:Homeobox protein tos8 [Marasmius crinis-equi]|uniref:Homeobox protein tos8 n=1 Tax=Marasmius crinis-equi TaxID=585013 RepID=A0ABR3ESA5_9AGAR
MGAFQHLYISPVLPRKDSIQSRVEDIYKGRLEDSQPVCLKVLRVFTGTYDRSKLMKMFEMSEGIRYLHEHHPPIVHSDIKGINILVSDDGHCRITDFGLSTIESDSPEGRVHQTASQAAVRGSVPWLAPELMNPDEFETCNRTTRDIYALGCTMYELFTGETPFCEKKMDFQILMAVLNGSRPVRPAECPDPLWRIIEGCWVEDALMRPTASGVASQLEKMEIIQRSGTSAITTTSAASVPTSSNNEQSTFDLDLASTSVVIDVNEISPRPSESSWDPMTFKEPILSPESLRDDKLGTECDGEGEDRDVASVDSFDMETAKHVYDRHTGATRFHVDRSTVRPPLPVAGVSSSNANLHLTRSHLVRCVDCSDADEIVICNCGDISSVQAIQRELLDQHSSFASVLFPVSSAAKIAKQRDQAQQALYQQYLNRSASLLDPQPYYGLPSASVVNAKASATWGVMKGSKKLSLSMKSADLFKKERKGSNTASSSSASTTPPPPPPPKPAYALVASSRSSHPMDWSTSSPTLVVSSNQSQSQDRTQQHSDTGTTTWAPLDATSIALLEEDHKTTNPIVGESPREDRRLRLAATSPDRIVQDPGHTSWEHRESTSEPRPKGVFKDQDELLVHLKRHGDEVAKAMSTVCSETAPSVMEIIQLYLDSDGSRQESSLRKTCIQCLFHLNKRHGCLPASLHLPNVVKEGSHAVAGGGFSDIYKGRLDNAQPVCLKVLRVFTGNYDRGKLMKQLGNEVLIWRQLRHPNIHQFLGISNELFDLSYCIVSPWMANGDVMTYSRKQDTSLDDKVTLMFEMSEGLQYLHEHHPPIVHSDIKGINVLICDEGHCRITDFGLSTIQNDSPEGRVHQTTSQAAIRGSLPWLAPELMNPEAIESPNRTTRDIYALGCTIYEILTGNTPFSEKKMDVHIILAVLSGSRPARPENCPDPLWQIIAGCWAEDAAIRPTVSGVASHLRKMNIAKPPQVSAIATTSVLAAPVHLDDELNEHPPVACSAVAGALDNPPSSLRVSQYNPTSPSRSAISSASLQEAPLDLDNNNLFPARTDVFVSSSTPGTTMKPVEGTRDKQSLPGQLLHPKRPIEEVEASNVARWRLPLPTVLELDRPIKRQRMQSTAHWQESTRPRTYSHGSSSDPWPVLFTQSYSPDNADSSTDTDEEDGSDEEYYGTSITYRNPKRFPSGPRIEGGHEFDGPTDTHMWDDVVLQDTWKRFRARVGLSAS